MALIDEDMKVALGLEVGGQLLEGGDERLGALVAFVILDGSWRGPEEFGQMFDEAAEVEADWLVVFLVLFADYFFTAIWYWGWIRWGQPRWRVRKASRKHVAHDDGGVAILADADGADGRSG